MLRYNSGEARGMKKLILFVGVLTFLTADARAAGRSYSRFNSDSDSSSSSGKQNMMADLSVAYVRDTSPQGQTDVAGRFNIGGMFSHWIGLDFSGLMEARSQSYLLGSDIRLVPIEWFFIKAGLGGYSDKATRTFHGTPTAGAGIKANLTDSYYFVTEASYFQVNNHNQMTVSGGVGIVF